MSNYLNAIDRHCKDCLEDLADLTGIVKQRPFTRIERRAAERSLQVLIEACIGVAKYWLKAASNRHWMPTTVSTSWLNCKKFQMLI